jgi:ABC-type dipeptide/oligopeptide/nickel transport system ATPase component
MMLPQGSAFAARCSGCMKCCLSKNPDLIQAGPGHYSRCWLTALEQAKQEETA